MSPKTPCPPWCTTDHETRPDAHTHWGVRTAIEVPGASTLVPDVINTSAVDLGDERLGKPQVCVGMTRFGRQQASPPGLWLKPSDAHLAATLVEMLATATPGQHREFAAGIERAAAEAEMEAGS